MVEPASCFAVLCDQVQPYVQYLLTQRKCWVWALVLGIRGKSSFPPICKPLTAHLLEDVPHLGVCSSFVGTFWMVSYKY